MDVNAFSISKHLSNLVGRQVSAKVASKADFAPEMRTACYRVEPGEGTAVVQIDLHLLASLGGTMIGYPPSEVAAQARTGELDENLTDATQEVMNVLSAVIVSEGRAIFKGLYVKLRDCGTRVQQVLSGGFYPLALQVTIAGEKPGYLLIASDLV